MDDLISRQAAIDVLLQSPFEKVVNCISILEELPSTESEPRSISYLDCSNAMLKMWMDNVLTDGEYNRIMDKLNAKYAKDMSDDSDEKD